MIYLTVGTEKYPFNRLVKILDQAVRQKIITEEIFGQIGTATFTPVHFPYQRFLPYNKMIEILERSRIVVSHAGIGSILTCLRLGKDPILFPRRKNFKEHVDDHQVEFMNGMMKRGKLLWATNDEELIRRILNYEKKERNLDRGILSSGVKELSCYLQKLIGNDE